MGEGEGEGGLINFPSLKRGGLIGEGGGLFKRGGLNRGFTVSMERYCLNSDDGPTERIFAFVDRIYKMRQTS